MKRRELKARLQNILAKHDLVGYPSEHDGFLKRVYPLTLLNLLISYPILLIQISFYCFVLGGALYLLIFSKHFYLIRILYLALVVLALGLIFRSYEFYHHFGGLTKTRGTWRKSTVLIDPNLPELKLVEVTIHEFYHFLEMKGLVRSSGETFATSAGGSAAIMAGADPYDDPEALFGMWIAANNNPNAAMERIMAGSGMKREEYPQFEQWLARGKLVGDKEITEEQKERALRYFQKRFEKLETAKKKTKRAKKGKTQRQADRMLKLLEEGADLGTKGEHEAALELFRQASDIAAVLENPDMQLATLQLEGLALCRLGRTDDSAQVLRAALDLALATDRYSARREILATLAETYREGEQQTKALKTLQELARIEQSEGDMEAFALTLSRIGHLLLAMGDGERSVRYFHRAGQISQGLHLLDKDTEN